MVACSRLLVVHARSRDPAAPIDRHALVTRHNPTLTAVDKSAPFMVGNGNIAFTADITGLQTFQEQYSPLVPLHDAGAMGLAQLSESAEVHARAGAGAGEGARQDAASTRSCRTGTQAKKPEIQWLRENPHRFSLGAARPVPVNADGKPAAFTDLSATRQTLDMWTGRLASSFVFDGAPVEVETSVHPDRDIVIVRLRSPLLSDGRLGVDLKFPGVAREAESGSRGLDASRLARRRRKSRAAPAASRSRASSTTRATRCSVAADRELDIADARRARTTAHRAAARTQLTLLVEFADGSAGRALPDAEAAREAVAHGWENYWTHGGVVDFTGSRDPRAARTRAAHRAVAVPHGGEQRRRPAAAGRGAVLEQLERQVPSRDARLACGALRGVGPARAARAQHAAGISTQLPTAKARAKAHGVRGAWWPKMVGPEGRESPSTVNPFIMWQQPHPIYLAETALQGAARRARRWRNTASSCSRPPSCSRAGRSTTARPNASCSARR